MSDSNRFRKILKYLDSPGAAMRQGISDLQQGEAPSMRGMANAFMDPDLAPTGAQIAEQTGLSDDSVLANTAIATAADLASPLDLVGLGAAAKGAKALEKSGRFGKMFKSTNPNRNAVDELARRIQKQREAAGVPFNPDQGVAAGKSVRGPEFDVAAGKSAPLPEQKPLYRDEALPEAKDSHIEKALEKERMKKRIDMERKKALENFDPDEKTQALVR